MKIAINVTQGAFNLSGKAVFLWAKKKGLTDIDMDTIPRNDPELIEVIEELGREVNGSWCQPSNIKVVEIPDNVDQWQIEEHDGQEWVAEKHLKWELDNEYEERK